MTASTCWVLRPRAMELPHREDVAAPEMVEAGVKLGSAGGGAADAVVCENASRAGIAERVELKLGVLVGGADSRVSDNCHYRVLPVS